MNLDKNSYIPELETEQLQMQSLKKKYHKRRSSDGHWPVTRHELGRRELPLQHHKRPTFYTNRILFSYCSKTKMKIKRYSSTVQGRIIVPQGLG